MAPQGIPGTCYREGLEAAPLDIYEGHREGLRADPLGLGSYSWAWKGGRLVLQDALVWGGGSGVGMVARPPRGLRWDQ